MTKDEAIKILWNYNLMHQTVQPADVIIACGSSDARIATKAGELWQQKYAPLVVCSGNRGLKVIQTLAKTEAEIFNDVLQAMGVPENAIVLEKESTNTGDNISFTMKILKEKGITPRSVILVHKPYMERRTYATFEKQFPDIKCTVTSPNLSFTDYTKTPQEEEHTLNLLAGDVDRVMKYPAKGYMTPQKISPEVIVAFKALVDAGYTQYLIKE